MSESNQSRPIKKTNERNNSKKSKKERNKSPNALGIPCVPISKRSGVSHWALLPHSRLSSPPFPIHFLSLQGPDGYFALHRACFRGHLECAKALLGAGADINKQKNNGATPLMQAARFGRIEVVRELLKRGAKKALKSNGGKTAYDFTCKGYGVDQSNKEEIKALLR